MAEFFPVNSLEIALRNVLRDPNTPLWSFYTPLASTSLWAIVEHHPELDGSDLIAPPGQNPGILTLEWPDQRAVSIYSAPERAERAFEKWEIPRGEWDIIFAPGYQLLSYVNMMDANVWINLGCEECQKYLDPDMIGILLERGEPKPQKEKVEQADFAPPGEPERYLEPLREFLTTQPEVQTAWIAARQGENAALVYEVALVMRDPEDDSLLEKVSTMAKALTPVEMNWTSSILMADKQSLKNLARQHRPFYRSAKQN